MGKGDKRRVRIALVVTWGLGVLGEVSAAGESSASTPEVSITDLGIRIERTAWLQDHMEHSRIPMPPSMMPDMPEHGQHRLSVEITLYNEGAERQLFKVTDLQLRSSAGHTWLPSSTTVESMILSTGQLAHLFLNFDVPPVREDKLQLIWQRGGTEQVMMAVPPPAPMRHASEYPD
jgi:hypothetical protein